jgi:hypothetical protein
MPWTFAHPAAVIPLRRFCPSRLNFAALAIGALTPDFGYYVGLFALAKLAHTVAGSVLVCLPVGLALLALFYLARKPIWYLLPQPHRAMLEPLVAAPAPSRLRDLVIASGSIVLGALSHIVWDSFTHRTGWIVVRHPLLQEPVLTIGSTELAVYHVLQHLSTLLGVVALVAAYYLWLRRRGASSLLSFAREDLWRYAFLTALSLASLALAMLLASRDAGTLGSGFSLRVFVFSVAVYGAALFIPMLLVGAVICYVTRREI